MNGYCFYLHVFRQRSTFNAEICFKLLSLKGLMKTEIEVRPFLSLKLKLVFDSFLGDCISQQTHSFHESKLSYDIHICKL